MKVRMKFKIEGTRNGVRWPEAGGVVDLPDAEAVELLSQGFADPVEVEKPEKAVAKKAETRKG